MTPETKSEVEQLGQDYLRELRDGRLAYKPSEAARLLGIDERTVHRLISTGQLRAQKVSSRLTLISRDALYDFLGIDVDESFRRVATQ